MQIVWESNSLETHEATEKWIRMVDDKATEDVGKMPVSTASGP